MASVEGAMELHTAAGGLANWVTSLNRSRVGVPVMTLLSYKPHMP